MSKDLTGYELSRGWFDFCFENPEKITPSHSAIFFFAIEHCNRLGWKEKFGFPTQMVMDAIGIKKHGTYIKYFVDLCEWGFFSLIQKSTNQYSSNIISLCYALPKSGKALDKAIITHAAKQTESRGQSNGSIDKPDNLLTIKPENQFLIPEMAKVFKNKLPNYPADEKKDYEPLLAIANFIINQLGQPGGPVKNSGTVLAEWAKITDWIAADNFYNSKPLKTISAQIQEIFQKKIKQHGTNGVTKNKLGSKSGGFGILTDAQKGLR